MSRIVITGGIVFTGEEVISPATVLVEGEKVLRIAPAGDGDGAGEWPGGVRIDASGKLVTPGLVNAHTHFYSALARGIPLKDPPPANFLQNLERLWWRLDRALTLEDIELSARFQAVECLRAGVTTVFDHHASQRAVRGSLGRISKALDELGLRACLCFEVSDREEGAAREGIEENTAYITEADGSGGDMRRARFGLHASFTLSDATLAACAAAADPDGVGFHIHVAEDRLDQEASRSRHSIGVIERLGEAGLLGERTICVHGIHLDDREIEILAGSRAWLVHCPQSNMNNAVGAASIKRFRDAGVRVALGTDGFTASVVREALAAHLLQNHLAGDPAAGYATVPGLLFESNAALAAETFGLEIGRLRAGGPADLVVWDYRPPTPLSADNIWGHVLFGLVGARAEEVVIAGKHVLRAGSPTACDEVELASLCAQAAERLWERF